MLRKYDKEWLEELCKDSYSLAEVLRKAGRKNEKCKVVKEQINSAVVE